MNKKLIRLNESDLHRIVKESVNRVLREMTSYDEMRYDTVNEYRSIDPEDLSDTELSDAINYMSAYSWALEGDTEVLHRYCDEARRRGL